MVEIFLRKLLAKSVAIIYFLCLVWIHIRSFITPLLPDFYEVLCIIIVALDSKGGNLFFWLYRLFLMITYIYISIISLRIYIYKDLSSIKFNRKMCLFVGIFIIYYLLIIYFCFPSLYYAFWEDYDYIKLLISYWKNKP